jgi:hypothetical protein
MLQIGPQIRYRLAAILRTKPSPTTGLSVWPETVRAESVVVGMREVELRVKQGLPAFDSSYVGRQAAQLLVV